jgi:ribonuclease-3
MTRVRASVVDEATLADVARRWHLGPALRLGVGEERAGGAERDSILSDAAEAVIAAVYLDAGFERAHALIADVWRPIVAERIDRETVIDSRSELQELLARRGTQVSHAVVFTASAIVDGDVVGTGTGGSKKAAAIAAARHALRAEGV